MKGKSTRGSQGAKTPVAKIIAHQHKYLEPEPPPKQSWGRQFLGALGGVVVGWAAMWANGTFGWKINADPLTFLLWGGALGAALVSVDNFAAAGAQLTHRPGRGDYWLNVLVALLAILAIFLVVYFLIVLVKVFAP